MRSGATSPRIGSFRWEGAALVTNFATHINNQAVTFEEIRNLNAERSEMTVDLTLVVQHGYTTDASPVARSSGAPNVSKGTNVFVRAAHPIK
jgi:hypothetical protein